MFPLNRPTLPRPLDQDQLRLGWEGWAEATADQQDQDLAAFMTAAASDASPLKPLLDGVFANSPYLRQSILREPEFLRRMVDQGFDAAFDGLLDETRAAATDETDQDALMRTLRIAKRRAALLIALADIAGQWELPQVTWALSTLADEALRLACRHLLRVGHDNGSIVLKHPDEPDRESGLIILAMGKHGALELNYSSDIDIIVLFDDSKVEYVGRKSVQDFFSRLARSLVQIMEERTVDGYVFRTDLRLRPDPGSTPPAVSLEAAELYYEGFGQNWERAAMIKARAVAGDIEAGRAFLRFLKPFIWRKHLDFAAIQDIHSIKRQINAHRGGGKIAMAGHNIKLGRGGIREIEFYAQTQQLIWGGREPGLRTSATCDSLRALADAERTPQEAVEELIVSYHYLRRLEHRLQMIEDRQTQTLPEDPAELAHLAAFMGYDDVDAFAADLTFHLQRVEAHYAKLFEEAPNLASAGGNLVFTGGENDPGTLVTLRKLGFVNVEQMAETVRGWHHGRVRAMRSTRARELLTELTPSLLQALANTAEPDAAFLKFDEFLSHLPAGVPLFSLFYANPKLLDLVAEILGNAPKLADHLSRQPTLLDNVLTPDFFDPPPGVAALTFEFAQAVQMAGDDFQEVLDTARRWAKDRKFQVGIQTLRHLLDANQSAHAMTDIADAVLSVLPQAVIDEFRRAHGEVPGAGLAIVAMGKMGSREMTASSDLDLILIYDAPEDVEQSNGEKPLSPSVYYSRLTQRILNAITAKTGEGSLYEVDMRLRPSGNAGPIATSFASFAKYHEEAAWTWEHMALTRARVVWGTPALVNKVKASIRDTLTRPRDGDKLLVDVADMRRRMDQAHHTDNPWEVKHYRGGLVDIEFTAQYLQLRHGHDNPDLLSPAAGPVFERAAELNLIRSEHAQLLQDGLYLWSAIQAILRLTIEGAFQIDRAPRGLMDVLAHATRSPDYLTLVQRMELVAKDIRAVFDRVIDQPAQALIESGAVERDLQKGS